MSLSVILITKNEAHQIEACLRSVAFADEWIVVDHGSQDDTVGIATGCGAKVVQTADWPGFGKQKNRALDLATGDWVLSIDADERITPALAYEIQQFMHVQSQFADTLDAAYVVDMPRRTQFCGQWIDHCGWSPDLVLRLFKRGAARFDERLVHESLHSTTPTQKKGHLRGHIEHFSYPSPGHYWKKLQAYSTAWAEQKHLEGQQTSIARAFVSGCFAFLKSYVLRRGFLDGGYGLVVCVMQAQGVFAKYFHLHFLNQKTGRI